MRPVARSRCAQFGQYVIVRQQMVEPPTSPAPSMRALVKLKDEPGLWMTEVATPQVGDGDVLIRVLRTGICGTDLHIYDWDEWARKHILVPLVVGHEFVGRVVEVG